MSERQDVTDWLTLQEAARIIGYSPSYLRTLIGEGKARAVKVGRQWFISPREAEQLRLRRLRLQDG